MHEKVIVQDSNKGQMNGWWLWVADHHQLPPCPPCPLYYHPPRVCPETHPHWTHGIRCLPDLLLVYLSTLQGEQRLHKAGTLSLWITVYLKCLDQCLAPREDVCVCVCVCVVNEHSGLLLFPLSCAVMIVLFL